MAKKKSAQGSGGVEDDAYLAEWAADPAPRAFSIPPSWPKGRARRIMAGAGGFAAEHRFSAAMRAAADDPDVLAGLEDELVQGLLDMRKGAKTWPVNPEHVDDVRMDLDGCAPTVTLLCVTGNGGDVDRTDWHLMTMANVGRIAASADYPGRKLRVIFADTDIFPRSAKILAYVQETFFGGHAMHNREIALSDDGMTLTFTGEGLVFHYVHVGLHGHAEPVAANVGAWRNAGLAEARRLHAEAGLAPEEHVILNVDEDVYVSSMFPALAAAAMRDGKADFVGAQRMMVVNILDQDFPRQPRDVSPSSHTGRLLPFAGICAFRDAEGLAFGTTDGVYELLDVLKTTTRARLVDCRFLGAEFGHFYNTRVDPPTFIRFGKNRRDVMSAATPHRMKRNTGVTYHLRGQPRITPIKLLFGAAMADVLNLVMTTQLTKAAKVLGRKVKECRDRERAVRLAAYKDNLRESDVADDPSTNDTIADLMSV